MTTTESALPPVAMLQGWLHAARQALSHNTLALPHLAQLEAEAALRVAAADWDLLFRAVLERLAQLAVEKPSAPGGGRRLPVPPGHDLAECLQALDQLRRAACGLHPMPTGQTSATTDGIAPPRSAPATLPDR